uniref:Uncharacterized protein n=1 Tax=Knipowitschia caucasica TaxID=637954 RepID=A0AAV2MI88_KNICA
MEAKGFYHERASRVAKTLFPRNENSPQAEVKQWTPGKRSPASSLRQGKTAKRLVTKKAAAVSMSLVRDNKDRWMADIEQRLAVRTAELTAERARVEDHSRIHQQSFGQVGRYGCLLFRHIISEENYQTWTKTTNWDGSRGNCLKM